MTGFGRAVVDGDLGTQDAAEGARTRWVIEVRSVNHRGFDLKVRCPDLDPSLEGELARAVRAVVERGTVTVAIREEKALPSGLDPARIRDTFAALEKVRIDAGIVAPVDLATVAAFLSIDPMGAGGGTSAGSVRHDESAATAIRAGLRRALDELLATRETEGASLVADIGARLGRVATLVQSVEDAAKDTPTRFGRRLKERLAVLHDAPGFDPGRVAQEIALLAERLDVSEEVVRLRAHLEQLGLLLKSAVPTGRKLDFVLQEAAREINTIGSKAQDAAIAALVIDCKAELEKIREQAQNIE
jgi:uncharacterized protein (TIGR00255 family)